MTSGPTPESPTDSRPGRSSGRQPGVLLYDEMGIHRGLLEARLAVLGLRFEAHDREEGAWNAWRSRALRLVVVFGAAGRDLGRRIAAERRPGTAEILAVVERDDEKLARFFLDAGVDDVLTLPCESGEIDRRLELAVRRLERGSSEETPFYERADFFRLLVDTMNAGLGVRDSNGRIVYVNDRFCRMLGYSRAEILGRGVDDFIDPDSRQAFAREVGRRPWLGASSYEVMMVKKDGQKIATVHSGRAVHSKEGTFRGSFAVVTEVPDHGAGDSGTASSAA